MVDEKTDLFSYLFIFVNKFFKKKATISMAEY